MTRDATPRTPTGQRIDAAFRAAYERGDRSASWQDAREWILAIEAEAAAPALTAEALAAAMAATHSAEGPKPKLSLVLLPWATRILARLASAAAEPAEDEGL